MVLMAHTQHLYLTTEQIDRATRDYEVDRLAVIDRAFTVSQWEPICRGLIEAHGTVLDRPAAVWYPRLDPETLDFGGAYRHTVVDSEVVRAQAPAFDILYADAVRVASTVVARDCIKSPYARSAISVKHYGPGDIQGKHMDTNPVSVLAFITDCPQGGELVIYTLDGGRRLVRPKAGDLLIFDGRSQVHEVNEQPAFADRIIVSFNTYHPDDTWRPAAIDTVMYENDPEAAT